MGQNAKRKKMITAEVSAELDALISRLPNFPNEIIKKGKLSGEQIIKLIESGKITGSGKEIDANKLYDFTMSDFVLIDHKKKVYDAYKENGDKGVQEYLKWLDLHINKLVKKYPNKFKIKQVQKSKDDK